MNINYIQYHVSEHYDVDPESMRNGSRKREVVLPKHIIWTISKSLYKNRITYQYLADEYNVKSHATVLLAVRTINGLRTVDKEFNIEYLKLENHCRKRILDLANVNKMA